MALEAETVATLRLIGKRKIALRIFVLVAGLVVAVAVLSLPLAPRFMLAAPPFLVWLWASYIAVDAWHVFRWRRGLMLSWRTDGIDLGVFANTIRSLPIFPQATVGALLHSLPILPPPCDCDLAAAEREAVAAFSDWRWIEETASVLLPGAVLGLAFGCVAMLVVGVTSPSATSIGMLCGLIAAVVFARLAFPARQRLLLTRAVAAVTPEGRSIVLELAGNLDWSRTRAPRRDRMLRMLMLDVQV